jgi:hypothetical protein
MINSIKIYFSIHYNNRFNDYWHKDTLFEIFKIRSEIASYEILCFDRKKSLTFHKKFINKKLNITTKEILCSYMVIIRTSLLEKNRIIEMLGQICKDNNCFGPIVYSDDTDILFFPKLRYQDGYLLKSIVEKHLSNKNFSIAYGGNDLVII